MTAQAFELVPRSPCEICHQEYEIGDFDDGICMSCSTGGGVPNDFAEVDLEGSCAGCFETFPRGELVYGEMCARCFDAAQRTDDGDSIF